MIKEKYPPNTIQLDNGNWIHYNPLQFLEDDNSTTPRQNGGR